MRRNTLLEEWSRSGHRMIHVFTQTADTLTHSSTIKHSPTTFEPVSTGGFFSASVAASAWASWRFSLSSSFNHSNYFGWRLSISTMYRQTNITWLTLTGERRSGSKNTTFRVRSTVTWSFCSSNCIKQTNEGYTTKSYYFCYKPDIWYKGNGNPTC